MVMEVLANRLRALRRKQTPVILQSELAECGLCCLLMVAAHHGQVISLVTARNRMAISPRGSTLAQLMTMARALGFKSRALRLELAALRTLALPCLLHWEFEHFVVLTRVADARCTIHDPATGQREVELAELGRSFTGVALELDPGPDFVRGKEPLQAWPKQAWRCLSGLKRRLVHLLVLTAMLQMLLLLAPLQIQWLIDDVIVTNDSRWIEGLSIGFAALVVLQAAMTAARGWSITLIGTQMNLRLFSDTLHHLVRLPMAWFIRRRTADVISRLGSVDTIHRTLAGGVIESLVDGAMLIMSLAMMLHLSVTLTWIPVCATALVAWIRSALQRSVQGAEEAVLVRGARRLEYLMETLRGMQAVKLAGQEQLRAMSVGQLAVHECNGELYAARWRLLGQSLTSLVLGLENVLTISLAALAVMPAPAGSSTITVGMVFAFLAYKSLFLQRCMGVLEKMGDFRMLSLHFHRLADITAAQVEVVPATGLGSLASWDLELRNVGFRFGDGDPLLFDDLSLRIADGQCIAIVGASGSGKSTLLKLMLGLLTPSCGDILIGGRSVLHGCPADMRACMGTVMQDDILFMGSISQNIAFFDVAADQELVETCARLAGLHDEIAAMPMSYRTLVGDSGNAMSGGQRQRLLLARALYRRPRVLFLDEATSHLDPVAESRINAAVSALGITRVVVAHRPQTIATADQVWRLDGGRLLRVDDAEHMPAVERCAPEACAQA